MTDIPPAESEARSAVRLRHALLPTAELVEQYRREPEFHHLVDQLVAWLPVWVAASSAACAVVHQDNRARAELAARGLPTTYSTGGALDPGDARAVLDFADELRRRSATPVEIAPEEVPLVEHFHRVLRSCGGKGTTPEGLADASAGPVTVARFLAYLESQGWAESSPHNPGDPASPRTWWARDNFAPHPYEGTGLGGCLHEVLGVRCRAPQGHALHYLVTDHPEELRAYSLYDHPFVALATDPRTVRRSDFGPDAPCAVGDCGRRLDAHGPNAGILVVPREMAPDFATVDSMPSWRPEPGAFAIMASTAGPPIHPIDHPEEPPTP